MEESKLLKHRINELLNKSEIELYSFIAEDYSQKQALPIHPKELVSRGKRLFNAQKTKLLDAICNNKELRTISLKDNDNADIVIEILQMISGLIFSVSPIALIVLVVKKGLKTSCNAYWNNGN